MSEAAIPSEPQPSLPTQPNLEVIQGDGPTEFGSLFDPIANPQSAIDLMTRSSDRHKDLVGHSHNPRQLVFSILTDLGMVGEPSANVIFHKQYLMRSKLLGDTINLMADHYEYTYWGSYDRRTGQDSDLVERLFDDTQAYVDSSPYLEIFVSLRSQYPNRDYLVDAERIVRLLVHNDAHPAVDGIL